MRYGIVPPHDGDARVQHAGTQLQQQAHDLHLSRYVVGSAISDVRIVSDVAGEASQWRERNLVSRRNPCGTSVLARTSCT